MIITELRGGLGNQLFQYAAGRALSLSLNTSLLLDLRAYENQDGRDTIRACSIEQYTIQATLATKAEAGLTRYPHPTLHRLLQPLGLIPVLYPALFDEGGREYLPELLTLTGNRYLRGFWQSPAYFDHIRPQLLQELTLTATPDTENATLMQQMRQVDSIAMHVRRGDFVTNSAAAYHQGTCSPEYYAAGYAILRKKLKEPVVFVFSDDLDWCRDNLSLTGKFHFVDHNQTADPSEDLRLMSSCKHFITANSTFSWWGAWLSQEPTKQVIAPKRWFNDGRDSNHLVPAAWQQI